jgi:hypothetical protein
VTASAVWAGGNLAARIAATTFDDLLQMFFCAGRPQLVLLFANGPFAMPELHHVVLFVVCFAGLTAFAVLFHRLDFAEQKRRCEEVKLFAAKVGFEYAESDRRLLKELGALSLFSWRLNRQLRNVIRKRSGQLEVLLFDYSFPDRVASDEAYICTQTVICFRLQGQAVPAFRLVPDGFVMSLPSLIGFRGITFTEDPEFKYMYALRGNDEAAIRTTFNETVRQWFTAHEPIEMESSGDAIIFCRKREILADEKIGTRLAEACEVVELMIPSLGPGERRLMSLASIRRDDGVSEPASDG